MEPKPDVIVVSARHEESVSAERAEILVSIQGSSLVTGSSAFKKAKEVAQLVDELERRGVPSKNIGLDSVSASISSGILGKSSSASYHLRIRCDDLELLPEVLGAVTAAKNAKLDEVVWKYPSSAEAQARWLALCIAQTNVKAEAAATALGARIVGVHSVFEQSLRPAAGDVPRGGGYELSEMSAPMARARSVDLGFELGSKVTLGLGVMVHYRVEGFGPPKDKSHP